MLPELAAAGVEVATVADARPSSPRRPAPPRPPGSRSSRTATVVDTAGDPRVTSALISGHRRRRRRRSGQPTEVACDLVAVSGGWSPVVHLHSQRQGKLRWDDDLVAFVPADEVEGQQIIGAARGSFTLEACLADGSRAGGQRLVQRRLRHRGRCARPVDPDRGPAAGRHDPAAVGGPRPGRRPGRTRRRTSSTCSATRRWPTCCGPPDAGMRSVEHIKRYTSISTANDQGKTSAVNAIGLIAAALNDGRSPGQVGTTTYRAPYAPVAFAALAGRNRGDLFDPDAAHLDPSLARRPRGRVRARRAVAASLVLPARRRVAGRGGAAGVHRRPVLGRA